jgi:hypothetical protein
LQAVHSGTDLQMAAMAVVGYRQAAMKGKPIRVDPVPGIATERLVPLLQAVLLSRRLLVRRPSVRLSVRPPIRRLLHAVETSGVDSALLACRIGHLVPI